MNSDNLGSLIKLGLSEKEAKVYLALIRRGEASVGELAKESTIHPRTAYDALESLVNKGIAAYAEKDGIKVFSPCSLDSLMTLVDEKKLLVESLMPSLEGQIKKHDVPLVRVFRGKQGMRAVWEDTLRENKTLYFYGGAMQGFRLYMKDYCLQWNRKREKQKMQVKFLYIDLPEVRKVFKNFQYWQAKPLPEKMYSSVAWWLYGDKMALVFWSEEPLAIVIQNQELARSYSKFFQVMWKTVRI